MVARYVHRYTYIFYLTGNEGTFTKGLVALVVGEECGRLLARAVGRQRRSPSGGGSQLLGIELNNKRLDVLRH